MGNKPSSAGQYSSYPSRRQPSFSQRPAENYARIGDNYKTLDQVTAALAKAGLESSNLIVGVDFTKSNEWSGRYTFGGRSLHAVDPAGQTKNPYEEAVGIIGKTLAKFDEDNLIPCYGFGDVTTHDKGVFSFFPDGRPCNGFGEALERYRAIVPHVRLAGPTSFAPIIEMAMKTTADSGGQYHVLVIIADGQVTRSADIPRGQLSPQEISTIDAIVAASTWPLSIILVGVGDGPWDQMKAFDDAIPQRKFDNFQFVNYSDVIGKYPPGEEREARFALNALMEIPSQYKAASPLLGSTQGVRVSRKAVPPPPSVPPPSAYPNSSPLSGYSNPGPIPSLYSDAGPPSTNYSTSRPPSSHYSDSHPNSGHYSMAGPPSGHYSPPQAHYTPPPAHYSPPGAYPPGVPYYAQEAPAGYPMAPPYVAAAPYPAEESLICPVCLTEARNVAFGCGHRVCRTCSDTLSICPLCRKNIDQKILLFGP